MRSAGNQVTSRLHARSPGQRTASNVTHVVESATLRLTVHRCEATLAGLVDPVDPVLLPGRNATLVADSVSRLHSELSSDDSTGHIARMCPQAGGFRGGFAGRGGFPSRPRPPMTADGAPVKC